MMVNRLYKYRSVSGKTYKDYERDRALNALLNFQAVLCCRKNFNDLFDSKIDFVRPAPKDFIQLRRHPGLDHFGRKHIDSWVSKGVFTHNGKAFLTECETSLNGLIDRYPIYSLSSHSTCNLLWAHYASNHTGFCIEFDFPRDEPRPVQYRDHVASIDLLDCIVLGMLDLSGGSDTPKRVREALMVKLRCWSYEGEYRWIADKDIGKLPRGKRFVKIQYDADRVKAIIFGCRASSKLKTYICRNLPPATKYKQAIEGRDAIEIVPFDRRKHL